VALVFAFAFALLLVDSLCFQILFIVGALPEEKEKVK